MKCNDQEDQESKDKKEEKKLKPENTSKSCDCDETPAEAGEGKRADDAATEELDKKARKTSNDSGALAGPKTKPTIRNTDSVEGK